MNQKFVETVIVVCLASVIFLGTGAVLNAQNSWPHWRGNPQNTGLSSTALPENLEPLWTFETRQGFESSAAIVAGWVYAAALDSNLYALELSSGKLKWKYRAQDEIKSSPSVSNVTLLNGVQRFCAHVDFAPGNGNPRGIGLFAYVYHPGTALGVKVG